MTRHGAVGAMVLAIAAAARAQGPDPAAGAPGPPPMTSRERIGVSLQSPHYNPLAPIGPNILFEGARDAHNLGFRTLKIAMHAKVVNPDWLFYRIPAADLARARTVTDIARFDVFRRTLDLPFRTFFITVGVLGEGDVWDSLATQSKPGQPRPVDRPLTESARANVYRQIHELARHLLTTYRGSGKVFVLQSPETDWRVLPYTDEKLEPSDVALANAFDYLGLCQRAVDDARREAKAEGVYLYHCVEVNMVRKSMAGRRTVASVILPRLDCDLVGYSSYETALLGDGSLVRAVQYLRAVARPSAAFGRNQVLISEIGVAERAHPVVAEALRSWVEAATLRVPWILQWTLYDNESIKTINGKLVVIYNATEADCNGLWVRKPDGSFGRFFTGYRPYLTRDPGGPEPTEAAAYVARAYRLLLDREPDPPGAALATRYFEETPWGKERVVANLLLSPEYRGRTSNTSAVFVFDAYRALLGRDPDPEPSAFTILARDYSADAARVDYLNQALNSDEARRRYVDWLFRRFVSRAPGPAEYAPWLDFFARGGSRKQAYEAFLAAHPR